MAEDMNQDVTNELLEDGDSHSVGSESDRPELSEIDVKLFALAKGEELEQIEGELQHPGISDLIIQGANLNAQDELGKTPLHYVVETEHQEREVLVQALMDAKANLLDDNEGKTPIHRAIDERLDTIASKMIKALCDRLQTSQPSMSSQECVIDDAQLLRKLIKDTLHKLVEMTNMNETVLTMLDFMSKDEKCASLLDKLVAKAWPGDMPNLSPFHLIALHGNEKLVMHEVVKDFTQGKWKKLRKWYRVEAVVNLLMTLNLFAYYFLTVITSSTINTPNSYDIAKSYLWVVLCLFVILNLSNEVHRLSRYGRRFFHDRWKKADMIIFYAAYSLVPLSFFLGAPSPFASIIYFGLTARMFQYFTLNRALLTYLTYLNVIWNMRTQFCSFFAIWGLTSVMFVGTFGLALPFPSGNETVHQLLKTNDTIGNRAATLGRVAVHALRAILDDEPTEEFYQGLDSGYTLGFWPMLILTVYSLVILVFLLPVLVAQVTSKYTSAEGKAMTFLQCRRIQIVTSLELSPLGRCLMKLEGKAMTFLQCCRMQIVTSLELSPLASCLRLKRPTETTNASLA